MRSWRQELFVILHHVPSTWYDVWGLKIIHRRKEEREKEEIGVLVPVTV